MPPENNDQDSKAVREAQEKLRLDEIAQRRWELRSKTVKAFTPEKLHDFAEELIIDEKLTVEDIRAKVMAKVAERQQAVGTPEPTAPEGGKNGEGKTPAATDMSTLVARAWGS